MVQSVLGLAVFMALAWAMSEDRSRLDWRTVAAGLALQFILAAALLKLPVVKDIFLGLNVVVTLIDDATTAGTSFVFGYLGGGELPFAEPYAGASFVLAFKALPIILVMSALSALLFYWRVLPAVVRGFSFVLRRAMNVGGALGVGMASNIFVGMVEAPLLVRPTWSR
jgi:CNT family concentrative nucleoside transporter